jgi:hypothetical protein
MNNRLPSTLQASPISRSENHPWLDLTWSLLYKANEAWFKRDTLNPHIINRTSSVPWDACHSLGSQAIEDIQFLWDMQQSPDFA